MRPFLPLFGASLAPFSTQIFFVASNGIGFVFKTCLSSHCFPTKQLRVSGVTPIFLSRCIKSKICNFYILWPVDDDLKTCPYVEFWWTFWLQAPLENFLYIKNIHTGYLKGPPRSGLYNGDKIMAIQRINHFLLNKTLIPPPKCGIWKSLLYFSKNRTIWFKN